MRTFTHTEVSPPMVAAHRRPPGALCPETSAEADLAFRTTCSYVMDFFRKNPEFDEMRA